MEEFFALKQAGGAGGSLSCSVLPGLSEPCNYCVSSVHLLRWVAPLQLSAAARVSSAGWRGCTSPPPHPVLLEKAGAACLVLPTACMFARASKGGEISPAPS